MSLNNNQEQVRVGPQRRRWSLFMGLAVVALLLLLVAVASKEATWAQPGQVGLRGTIPAEINGHVNLEGHGAPPNPRWLEEPMEFQLLLPSGTVTLTTMVTIDQSGDFVVPGIPEGTYDATVKGFHSLRTRVNGIQVVFPVTAVDFGTQPEGDANNDNTVNAIDASIMASAYWKTKGSPGYDARADFNNDGTIDALDASLLATNYWKNGQ